jgi:hypothetical protein
MILTRENYYGFDADLEYMSVSQYSGWQVCQLSAYEKYVKGTHRVDPKTAYIEGNFIHTWFEGKEAFDEYLKIKEVAEDVFNKPKKATKDNPNPEPEMCARYKLILNACEKAKQDSFFMSWLDGEHEKIYTAEWLGIKWKIRCDVVNEQRKFIADIKGMATLGDSYGGKEGEAFYERYNYWQRWAVYQKIAKLATGIDFRLVMPCLTKEESSDRQVYEFDIQERLDYECRLIERGIEEIKRVKADGFGFTQCDTCDVCKENRRPVLIKAKSKITDYTIT